MEQNSRIAGTRTGSAARTRTGAAAGTRTGGALLAVLGGAVLAAAVDFAENYGFVHLVPDPWQLVAMSYVVVGLVTAAPMMFIRPTRAVVPALATLLAVPAFIGGDLAYVVASSMWNHVSFDFADYMLSYAEFQRAYTVRLELLAPACAGLLAWLRFRRLRVANRTRGRGRARGRHEAVAVRPGHRVPSTLHHAEVD
jgi:hypothetical protein